MRNFKTSLYGGGDSASVAEVVRRVSDAADTGWHSIWFSQGAGVDVHTALAVAASIVDGIHVGSAVIPIQGRHPISLAQQALSVSSAAGPGRFTIGVGVTHPAVSEGWYGIPYNGIVDLCVEEIEALAALLVERRSEFVGQHLTARTALDIDAASPRLMLAALGPRMLQLAGRLTDGVVTWMTGPKSLKEHVAPALTSAAERAGRPEPALIVGLPICVTDNPEEVKAGLAEPMARTAAHRSYRRMITLEGVRPEEIAIVGDESDVMAGVTTVAAAGATEILVNAVGNPEERARTQELLTSVAT